MDTFFPLPSSFTIYPGDHTAVSIVWMNYNLSSILLMTFSCVYSFAIQIAQQCITTCVGLFLFFANLSLEQTRRHRIVCSKNTCMYNFLDTETSPSTESAPFRIPISNV